MFFGLQIGQLLFRPNAACYLFLKAFPYKWEIGHLQLYLLSDLIIKIVSGFIFILISYIKV